MTVANSAGSERDAVLRIFTSIILPYPHNKAMKPVVLLFPFLHEKKKISERKMTFPGSFSGRTKIASLTLARAPLSLWQPRERGHSRRVFRRPRGVFQCHKAGTKIRTLWAGVICVSCKFTCHRNAMHGISFYKSQKLPENVNILTININYYYCH